jgi:uncharacterized protein
MQAEEQNYGVVGEHGAKGAAMSAQEEKSWSVLAHLSIFLNVLTGFLGPLAALVIWLVYRDRSPKVAFHALQSMWYQVAWLVLLGVGWAFTGLLMLILIGFLLVPVMALLTVVPFVHAAYAAYRVGRCDDYRYPFVADLIEDR